MVPLLLLLFVAVVEAEAADEAAEEDAGGADVGADIVGTAGCCGGGTTTLTVFWPLLDTIIGAANPSDLFVAETAACACLPPLDEHSVDEAPPPRPPQDCFTGTYVVDANTSVDELITERTASTSGAILRLVAVRGLRIGEFTYTSS